MKPWLVQKSIELMQEREDTFVDLVLNLLDRETEPRKITKKLEKVFFDATKQFVKDLWRFIIFEQLKIKHLE